MLESLKRWLFTVVRMERSNWEDRTWSKFGFYRKVRFSTFQDLC
jgi:hypothetical protein